MLCNYTFIVSIKWTILKKTGCISAEAIKKGVYFTENSPFQFQEQSSITEFAVVLFMLLITAHSQIWLYLP